MKAILEFLSKNNRWAILLVIILLLLGSGIWKLQRNAIDKWKDKYQTETKLKNALVDTVHYYKNSYGEVVAEKLTLQASVKDLEKIRDKLTVSQKELLKRVKEANRKNTVIAAALIRAEFVIDSLKHRGTIDVDTTNKTVRMAEENNPHIQYDFLITGVLPYPKNTQPSFYIEKLRLPNKQMVDFHWKDDKKEGYPIEFTVSNSNKYMKTYDINSYAIPNIDKEIVNPTGWEKVGIWLKKNGKIIGYTVGGVVVGAGGTYMLMK